MRPGGILAQARALQCLPLRGTAAPVQIVRGGVAVGAEAERQAAAILAGPSFTLGIELGDGPGRARYLTSDLGHTYVDVNAGYRS